MVIAFTDGSSFPNPGKGKFAYIITDSSFGVLTKFESNVISNTTNNIMELSAIIKVLEDFGPKLTAIYSDSMYCVKGITKCGNDVNKL